MLVRNPRRTLFAATVALALALATYAFTASNVVPASKAGKGEGAISGFVVSAVTYTLSASNPANIDSVSFTLDSTATTVKAKLVQSSSTYTDCTITGGTLATCDFAPDVSVVAADELSVVAVR
ncbi:MAG TPA: hypothetical protein VNJ53_09860 [Gaiellaceae bacterium]|nr:hypothetical protein [Gaiellaceae bacterium]